MKKYDWQTDFGLVGTYNNIIMIIITIEIAHVLTFISALTDSSKQGVGLFK